MLSFQEQALEGERAIFFRFQRGENQLDGDPVGERTHQETKNDEVNVQVEKPI